MVKNKELRTFFSGPGKVGTMCRDISVRNGLVMGAVANRMIIAPPLVISHTEIDELIDKVCLTLNDTLDVVRREGLG